MKLSVMDFMDLEIDSNTEEYSEERVRELWGNKKRLTPHEICDLKIPSEDKVVVLLTCITQSQARLFACDCAETDPYKDESSDRFIAIARRHADGFLTREELSDAHKEAWKLKDTDGLRITESDGYEVAWDMCYNAGWNQATVDSTDYTKDERTDEEEELRMVCYENEMKKRVKMLLDMIGN